MGHFTRGIQEEAMTRTGTKTLFRKRELCHFNINKIVWQVTFTLLRELYVNFPRIDHFISVLSIRFRGTVIEERLARGQ